jgi:hypothetical protein
MPEDGGRITTFSQEWQGDRWHWQTGLRVFNGATGHRAAITEYPLGLCIGNMGVLNEVICVRGDGDRH